jgi:cytidine deaminase
MPVPSPIRGARSPERFYPLAVTSDEEQSLFEAALVLAKEQAIADEDGEGVGAAALADDGAVLTGVWIDAMVDSACLCAETGPICEAHVTGRALVASICVRWAEGSGATVLAACGVCQERLAIFGTDLLIGLADPSTPGYRFAPLASLRPQPWWDALDTATSEGS